MNVKLTKMFKFNQPLQLPPQLQWNYAHEPALMEWTIRARNYNTFVANCLFVFMVALASGWATIAYFSFLKYTEQPWRILSAMLLFVVVLSVMSSMTHQKINYAFRITASGIEYCKWKDFPKWALTFTKWFAGITALIFIALAFSDPAFLIGAFVGPGGMALMYFSMLNSKNFQDMHTQYHHYPYKWDEITQLAVATNREVVDIKYSVIREGREHLVIGNLNIFCRRKQKEQVASLIKSYLPPEVPFVRAKVNVPMSTV